MYTVRLHLGDKDYIGTERSIKLAKHVAAQLAFDDHKNLLIKNSSDQDMPQINGKIY